ncbi:AAA family ATPase [Vibrio alginolyticus]|nr:AAA family ATPase [Vibrio alginolyticus]
MYKDFFGFVEQPFSIVPSSRYLYLSQRHKEAITHLKAGLGDGSGFAMLTGEVGTGKTTVAKAMLANLDESTKAGLILNPTFSTRDLLEAICDEFKIIYPQDATLKQLSQVIHHYLLSNHNAGWQTLLVIDEAQHLASEVLEQLRLLTNLETESRKLLKVLLVGQPELQRLLQTTQLRQLAQRITGRYHLLPLDINETADYIAFRLHTAGGDQQLFSRSCCKTIAKYSHGIPRLINLICDKALYMSYQQGSVVVDRQTVSNACNEVMQFQADIYQQGSKPRPFVRRTLTWPTWASALIGIAAACGVGWAVINYPVPPISKFLQQTVSVGASERAVVPEQLSSDQREQLFLQKESNLLVKELYRLWGYHAYIGDSLCLSEALSTMVCERKVATWPMLMEQSRPVILELNDHGETGYVILYAIGKDKVEVLNGKQRLRLPISWLTPMWQGNIIELWQAPLKGILRMNMEGAAIEVLDQLLAEALNEVPLGKSIFDAEMKKRVEYFQRMQGIGVDGIAGQLTLDRLQQSVQPEAPSLVSIDREEV